MEMSFPTRSLALRLTARIRQCLLIQSPSLKENYEPSA